MHPEGTQLSQHLRSRKEVGDIFLKSSVPAVVLLRFHGVIFKGMANRITAAAASISEGNSALPRS